jgi:hypothetical protein
MAAAVLGTTVDHIVEKLKQAIRPKDDTQDPTLVFVDRLPQSKF